MAKYKRMATVYTMGAFGLTRCYGMFKRAWEQPWAQYQAVPFCEIVPEGKRKAVIHSGNGFHTYIVVVDGSGPTVSDNMEDVSDDGTVRVSKTRYASFAPEWTEEADKLIAAIYETQMTVMMDCRHTIPVDHWRRYDRNSRRVARFMDTDQHFQNQIRELAAKWGKDVPFVYSQWREYSYQCEIGDQSPVMFEFEQVCAAWVPQATNV